MYTYIHIYISLQKKAPWLSHAISLPSTFQWALAIRKTLHLYADSPRRQGGVRGSTFSRSSWQHSGCRVDVSCYDKLCMLQFDVKSRSPALF